MKLTSHLKKVKKSKKPLFFADYFDLGQKETESPFLIPSSRKWGAHLTLKSSFLALLFLVVSFSLSFFENLQPLSSIFLLFVYFFAGIPALIESLEDLTQFDINIDILMTLAAFSSVLIGSGMEGGLLLVLFALSGAMEDAVSLKAKSAISSLHKLSPSKATVVDAEGNLIEKSIKDIAVGTTILVKASQVIPLDGIVIQGVSSVNLVHLTGENFPIRKKVGDSAPAGAKNLEGALTLKVTAPSSDSTLAKIIALVAEAQDSKPKLQRFFDSFSPKYAISIIILSGFFALTLPYLIGIPFLGTHGSIYRALSFLIAASPCALIIAIPIAYLSAISALAKKGILIKGGITLDALAGCTVLAIDKTGTLTTGNLEVLSVEGMQDEVEENKRISKNEALSIAFGLEKNAVHPIAKALIDHAKKLSLNPLDIDNFAQVPGFGLTGFLKDKRAVSIGRADFVASKVSPEKALKLIEKTNDLMELGELIAVLNVDEAITIFSFQDDLRPEMKKIIDELKNRQQLDVIILTGDHLASSQKMATKLGIDQFYSNLTPQDKFDMIAELAKTKQVAMIGDGVNDAPALARATVGISMGKLGSESAVDAADVVLLHDNIEYLDFLFSKAKETKKIVGQNLTLAIAAIFVAALPALLGFIPLWLAVVLHEGGTVLVGLNGLRLLRK